MSITIDFPPIKMAALEEIAAKKQITIETYIKDIISQAIQKEELAKIDCAIEQVKQGKVVYKTMDELLEMAK